MMNNVQKLLTFLTISNILYIHTAQYHFQYYCNIAEMIHAVLIILLQQYCRIVHKVRVNFQAKFE